MNDFSIIIHSIDGELPRLNFNSYDGAWHAAIALSRSPDIVNVVIYRAIPVNRNEVEWEELWNTNKL